MASVPGGRVPPPTDGEANTHHEAQSANFANVPAARIPVAAILGVSMLVAGIVYPVTGSALDHTTPITIAAVRAIGGGVLLTLALPLLGSRLPRSRRLWTVAALIGFGNTTLTLVGISEGTSRAGAAVASVLLNTAPFFVAILGRIVLAERLSQLRLAGLVVGFAGVLAVVLSDPGDVAHGSALATGIVLALVGALGWAAAGLGMRWVSLREPELMSRDRRPRSSSAAAYLCCSCCSRRARPSGDDASLWAALAFLVIGGQVLGLPGLQRRPGKMAVHEGLRLDVPGARRWRWRSRRCAATADTLWASSASCW